MKSRLLKTEYHDGYLYHSTPYIDYNQESLIDDLHVKFEKNRICGKIKSEFADDVWRVQDTQAESGMPLSNIRTINFEPDKAFFEEYGQERFDYREYINYLKYYAMLIFDNDFSTVQRKISRLKKLIDERWYFQKQVGFIHVDELYLLIDFSQYLPIDLGDYFEDLLITPVEGPKKQTRPRCLCNLVAYYTINEELTEFWDTDASERDKVYYFPFYLFWKFCSIVPMRPKEFAMTPIDCLTKKKEGFNFARVYGEIKGQSFKKGNRHDSSQYPVEWIPIPDELAAEIVKYKDVRRNYQDDGLLFSTKILSDYHPVSPNTYYHPVFTRDNLLQIKNQFYSQYLIKKKGYMKIDDKSADTYRINYSGRSDNRIAIIDCEDIRHIAMINLTRNGCSLQALMRISHHRTAELSTWYSNNVDQFEKARVFVIVSRLRRRIVKDFEQREGIAIQLSQYKSSDPVYGQLYMMSSDKTQGIDMGDVYCISLRRIKRQKEIEEQGGGEQDISDCLVPFSKHPQNPCLECRYQRPKKETIKEVDKQLKREFKVNMAVTLNAIPKIGGGSLIDIDRELEEYLKKLETCTDIQRGMEVAKYKCHK